MIRPRALGKALALRYGLAASLRTDVNPAQQYNDNELKHRPATHAGRRSLSTMSSSTPIVIDRAERIKPAARPTAPAPALS